MHWLVAAKLGRLVLRWLSTLVSQCGCSWMNPGNEMEGRAPDFSLIESVIIDAACSLPALSVYVAVRCPSVWLSAGLLLSSGANGTHRPIATGTGTGCGPQQWAASCGDPRYDEQDVYQLRVDIGVRVAAAEAGGHARDSVTTCQCCHSTSPASFSTRTPPAFTAALWVA